MLGFQGYKRRVQVVGAYAEFPARFNAVDLLPVSRVVDIVEIKAGDAVSPLTPCGSTVMSGARRALSMR